MESLSEAALYCPPAPDTEVAIGAFPPGLLTTLSKHPVSTGATAELLGHGSRSSAAQAHRDSTARTVADSSRVDGVPQWPPQLDVTRADEVLK